MKVSKKAKKSKKSVKLGKTAVQRAELWRTTLRHNRISSMLRESEKWLRIAELRNPKFERGALLREMISRKNELSNQLNKLRKAIGPSALMRPLPPAKTGEPSPETIDELGYYAKIYDSEVEFRRPEGEYFERIGMGPPTGIVSPLEIDTILQCAPTSGTRKPLEPAYADVLSPYFNDTQSYRNFARVKTDDWDGVSFADMFIDVGDAGIFIDDAFEAACLFSFPFPKVPCDGRITYWLRSKLVLSPCIEADLGTIHVDVCFLRHLWNDGTDAINDPDMCRGYGIDSPDLKPVISDDIVDSSSIEVSSGERAALDVAVKVSMYVGGGRASFSQDGTTPHGHYIFLRPPGTAMGTPPSIAFTFEPTG